MIFLRIYALFMSHLINLKDLRQNMTKYAALIAKGGSFVVMKRSKPLFRISPANDERWEEVIDFTKVKKGGVKIKEILSRL